ncbi:hypothetical protein ACFL1X_04965 [Candidatus Hydrogenedentota bacterium]
MSSSVPENLYEGELLSYPGPWSFLLGRSKAILVSDEELEALAEIDKEIDVRLRGEARMISLRSICEEGKARGDRTLVISFDYFFRTYRPGHDGQIRRLMPDTDEYVALIAKISKFTQQYGIGLELSLLSPLEIGRGYHEQTGESGSWMHYRKGLRDPESGTFSVQMWRHCRWANNKGPIDIEDMGVRVFAFRETPIAGTPYMAVDPDEIVEITDTAKVEVWGDIAEGSAGDFHANRIRVYGEGRDDIGDLDRVLIVQRYSTPEMDYFSENAFDFLHGLIDKYDNAGVKLNGLYSDEMHIQQDWAYFNHHDNGEFALRYVSDGFQKKFAEQYGQEYADFAKYLLYFAHGQDDFSTDLRAKSGVMNVIGSSPEDIRRTALLRSRYFHFLQDGVVDLFTDAKKHAEEKMRHKLEARAHATWAESPTIDNWNVGKDNQYKHKYEYTSNFVWSCTVHQAAAACYDYFKWGDFLTGNGNDHAEGGWIDRNYFGLALGCSTGILNDVPYSYAGHWGMPADIRRRRDALCNTYGTLCSGLFGMVQEMEHRDVDVLTLYPLDLVAVEERFGSWMTQYGYANMVTQDKLLERGQVVNGGIEMAGRRFTTLATMFEPFPSKKLLDTMEAMVSTGGRVIWSGPPPVLTSEGEDALEQWQAIFGVDYKPCQNEGRMASGNQITFEGKLSGVNPQIILTEFLVDHIYPVTPRKGTGTVARVKEHTVGTHRGGATFLGYRPRDDQSKSLGYEMRNWFEVLSALDAYESTGAFKGVNDNTEHVSRNTEYLTCRFPNGTVAISRHYREVEEDWFGGFGRNEEEDNAYIAEYPQPTEAISLNDFKVNGHSVTFEGEHAVAFRVNNDGTPVAFAGVDCREITVDGKTTTFSMKNLRHIAWGPVADARKIENGAVFQINVVGEGKIRIPCELAADGARLFAEGATPGSKGEEIPARMGDGKIILDANEKSCGRWLYLVA